jgi:uncharacterized protein DUF1028
VTADGRSAAFTGRDCMDWAGHVVGDGFAVQGNMLVSGYVLAAMRSAFLYSGVGGELCGTGRSAARGYQHGRRNGPRRWRSDPNLFNPCGHPSPDGTLLLCETFSEDGSQNGIHTNRSSDGGGLTQITSNPGGDDIPGDWSPNGKRIVFQRFDSNFNSEGLFVVNTNGTGLKQITPPDFSDLSSFGSWSPQ